MALELEELLTWHFADDGAIRVAHPNPNLALHQDRFQAYVLMLGDELHCFDGHGALHLLQGGLALTLVPLALLLVLLAITCGLILQLALHGASCGDVIRCDLADPEAQMALLPQRIDRQLSKNLEEENKSGRQNMPTRLHNPIH